MAGVNEVEIYENGIGAINLPFSNAQLGSQNSRATHPIALKKIEQFLTVLLEQDFSLRLPYLYSTKGQVCRELRRSRLADLAVQSISCDSFSFRSSGPEQCGICTSCILRRQALWTAGFREDLEKGRYRQDIFVTEPDYREPKLALRLAPLWDMLSQVERIDEALVSSDPWSGLTIDFPDLFEIPEVLGEQMTLPARKGIRQRLATLYREYCNEWHRLPAYTRGWKFGQPELRLSA
jgi:hypothetical protein